MHRKLYYDIESDGLLDSITRVWIICAIDLETKEEFVFNSQGKGGGIQEGLKFLSEAELLVGHNSIRYDAPALKQLFGWVPQGRHLDTMILGRLKFPNVNRTDKDLVAAGKLPGNLQGRDSLKAWGHRVGEHKADYKGGFAAWSQEMEDYCVQDCRTGVAIWEHIKVDTLPQEAVELEHQLAHITFEMERAGWLVDEKAAGELYTRLVARRHELETALVAKFGSWEEVDRVVVPKRDNKTRGYKTGVPVTIYKTVQFNPSSRRHIEKKLRELGWNPTEFTPSGQAQLDEEILENIDIPEAQLIIEYLLVQKRLGQLADGKEGILKKVKNGKIHCWYKTLGTVTGRCAHANPNIAQTPSNDKPYGPEFRALYIAPKGWTMVGVDFEGLELRCLAHALSFFDEGAYAKVVTEGDIHSYHAQAMGGVERQLAKRWVYAWLYGGGPPKLAGLLGVKVGKAKAISESFLKRVNGLEKLKEKVVKAVATSGGIKSLDKRFIPSRSQHSCLNALLQSYGAVLCKRWVVDAYNDLIAAGYKWGYDGDFVMVGWIHDEIDTVCREGIEKEIGEIIANAARRAGDRYGFRCRLDSKPMFGTNWSTVH